MKPLRFILYDNRSGSTLLAAMLNRHRDIGVTQECDYIFQILECRKPVREIGDARALLESLQAETRFRELHIATDQVIDWLEAHLDRTISKGLLIRAITCVYFSNTDPLARVHVIKSPRVHYHMHTLVEMFPDCRFVHIIRDGRAVFNSKCRSISSSGSVMDDNVVHAAAVWRRKLVLARAFPSRTYRLRYEDLITQPEASIELLLSWLGISEEGRRIVKEQSAYAGQIGDKHRQLHTNVARAPQRQYIDNWQNALADEDVYVYEMLNHRYLSEEGYALRLYDNCSTGLKLRALMRFAQSVGRLYLSRMHRMLIASQHRQTLVSELRRKLVALRHS